MFYEKLQKPVYTDDEEAVNIVLNETMYAFGDAHGALEDMQNAASNENRKLTFIASYGIPQEDAVRILYQAVPTYNDFEAEEVDARFPFDCYIYIARVYSPCIYVKQNDTPLPSMGEVMADECEEIQPGLFRYWWD
jgi:hypothetical protein